MPAASEFAWGLLAQFIKDRGEAKQLRTSLSANYNPMPDYGTASADAAKGGEEGQEKAWAKDAKEAQAWRAIGETRYGYSPARLKSMGIHELRGLGEAEATKTKIAEEGRRWLETQANLREAAAREQQVKQTGQYYNQLDIAANRKRQYDEEQRQIDMEQEAALEGFGRDLGQGDASASYDDRVMQAIGKNPKAAASPRASALVNALRPDPTRAPAARVDVAAKSELDSAEALFNKLDAERYKVNALPASNPERTTFNRAWASAKARLDRARAAMSAGTASPATVPTVPVTIAPTPAAAAPVARYRVVNGKLVRE